MPSSLSPEMIDTAGLASRFVMSLAIGLVVLVCCGLVCVIMAVGLQDYRRHSSQRRRRDVDLAERRRLVGRGSAPAEIVRPTPGDSGR